MLTFVSAPDYETKSSYSATVTASDGTNSTAQTITVTITDVDDAAPVFTSSSTFSAAENQTSIGTVTATDVDTNDASITFSISESELAITSGGVLTFANAPDYEMKSSYTATVTASDGKNTSTQDVTVNITDINDAPYFTNWRNSNYELIANPDFIVSESINPRNYIGAFSPRDQDGDEFTFSISGNELKIDGYDKIYFVSAPDFETKSFFNAILTISDGELSKNEPEPYLTSYLVLSITKSTFAEPLSTTASNSTLFLILLISKIAVTLYLFFEYFILSAFIISRVAIGYFLTPKKSSEDK